MGGSGIEILKRIENSYNKNPEKIAFHSRAGEITYKNLWEKSDKLAAWIVEKKSDDFTPIVVYGHKSPFMLVCFLACVKAGRAYCPVDLSMPSERIAAIVKKVGNNIVFTTEEIPHEVSGTEDIDFISANEINKIIDDACRVGGECQGKSAAEIMPLNASSAGKMIGGYWVKPDDVFYIIFTSGSTGEPKGVKISASSLESFVSWMADIVGEEGGTFLNQAPFSFDLSVMDLYTSLCMGGTLQSIDKELQSDFKSLMEYLKEADINYWVSTPSFVDLCFTEPLFNGDTLSSLKKFLFCGEKLTKETTAGLFERFQSAEIINTYGPTEATVAVTSIKIEKEMLEDPHDLPIGTPKPGTELRVIDAGLKEVASPQKGEIMIVGDTVSFGYFNDEEKTAKVFSEVVIDGKKMRAYRTGDEGYVKDDGNYYIVGRIDQQIKLHGYRIELGDIEQNLLKVEGISGAAVVPKESGGKIRHLVAFIVKEGSKGDFSERKLVKTELKNMIPSYMIPKKIEFVESLPLTGNGKLDRKKLREMV